MRVIDEKGDLLMPEMDPVHPDEIAAANVALAESDLTRIAEETRAQIEAIATRPARSREPLRPSGGGERERELWPLCLGLTVSLLVVESLLARALSRGALG